MNISGISGIGSSAYIASTPNAAQSTTASLPTALTNLNLTQAQQTQISQMLQNAQSGTVSSSQLKSEIESVLTPSQLAQLRSEHHGHHHGHKASSSSSSSDSTSGTSSDEDAFGVTIPTSTASSTSQSISNVAATFWAQSQLSNDTQT
jgi:Spy/CpxP family protein refolding chaperone